MGQPAAATSRLSGLPEPLLRSPKAAPPSQEGNLGNVLSCSVGFKSRSRTIFGISPPRSLPNQLPTPFQSFHIFLPLTSETARKVPASLFGSDSRSAAGVARGMGVGCQVTSWPSGLGSSCLRGLTPTAPKCRGGRELLIRRGAQRRGSPPETPGDPSDLRPVPSPCRSPGRREDRDALGLPLGTSVFPG